MSKVKEEKYYALINRQKKMIFDKNYGNKISQANESTSKKYSNNNKKKLRKNNDDPIGTYIEQIKQQYKENPIYFESLNSTNSKDFYKYSFCFNCQHIVVAYQDKVICTNGCYQLDVNTDEFNSDYSLDMFLNQYDEYTSEHMFCERKDIVPIYIDNEEKYAFFICKKCDKKYFDKAGIIL